MLTLKTRLTYLLAIGAIFYASYGPTNHFTALRDNVPEIVFAWEHQIPFWAWTIVPYWSLNGFYALAFLLAQNRAELHHYASRLLLAQLIAIVAFWLFPLQMSWQKPETSGISGLLFQSLTSFDKPYNQAPSLHIVLCVVVGAFYWKTFPKWRLPLCLWFGLIALSILTTYQHHFIDLPTGALVGYLVLWLLPEHSPNPLFAKRPENLTACNRRLSGFYLLGAAICTFIACLGGVWLWALWGTVALSLVAVAYWRGVAIFQKQPNGKLTAAGTVLLLPYLIGARLNIAYWLNGKAKSAVVFENVFVGSITESAKFDAVLDCCAELPCCNPPTHYQQALMLDLAMPSVDEICKSAEKLDRLQRQHLRVLVACALGYGRSVAVVLGWLVLYQKMTPDNAIAIVKQARPQMVLSDTLYQRLQQLQQGAEK